jgi:hypothetical protein
MRRWRRVAVRTYRAHRLEILDDSGQGWAVAIHATDPPGRALIRNTVPHGLEALLDEARRRIDLRLDGPPWRSAT